MLILLRYLCDYLQLIYLEFVYTCWSPPYICRDIPGVACEWSDWECRELSNYLKTNEIGSGQRLAATRPTGSWPKNLCTWRQNWPGRRRNSSSIHRPQAGCSSPCPRTMQGFWLTNSWQPAWRLPRSLAKPFLPTGQRFMSYDDRLIDLGK